MAPERGLVHLKAPGTGEVKCGATDASDVTNWVRGATFDEIYVPADVLDRAARVCNACQEAALDDDSGSDDVVEDETDAAAPDDVGSTSGPDPAFAEVSDERLLSEIARRLREGPLS